MRLIDLTNQRFGNLVAYRRLPSANSRTYWLCACDCGNECRVDAGHLRSRHTESCGCLQRSCGANLRHGRSTSPEYLIWNAMRQRCTNPKDSHYRFYGARGITVCEPWMRSFEAFFADMGSRPPGLTLDRMNNDGNYEFANCRWATRSQQNKNRRPRRKVFGEII